MWRCRCAGSPAPTTTRWCWSTRPRVPAACRSTWRETDVYYFAPQKSFAVRRRAVAGADVAGRDRAGRARSRRPAAGSRRSATCRSRSTTPGWTRPTTRRRWPRCSCSPTSSTGSTARAGSTGPPARTADSQQPALHLGREVGVRDAVRHRPGAALRGRRHHRLRRRASTPRAVAKVLRSQRDRRHRALPQARPQPAADRDVPGGRPGRRRGADRLHRPRRRRARQPTRRDPAAAGPAHLADLRAARLLRLVPLRLRPDAHRCCATSRASAGPWPGCTAPRWPTGALCSALIVARLAVRFGRVPLIWAGLTILCVGIVILTAFTALPATLTGAFLVLVRRLVRGDLQRDRALRGARRGRAGGDHRGQRGGRGRRAPSRRSRSGVAVLLGSWRSALLVLLPVVALLAVVGRGTPSLRDRGVRATGVPPGAVVPALLDQLGRRHRRHRRGVLPGAVVGRHAAPAHRPVPGGGLGVGHRPGGRHVRRPGRRAGGWRCATRVDRLLYAALALNAVGLRGVLAGRPSGPVAVTGLLVLRAGRRAVLPARAGPVDRRLRRPAGPRQRPGRPRRGARVRGRAVRPRRAGRRVGIHTAMLVVPALLVVAALGIRLGPVIRITPSVRVPGPAPGQDRDEAAQQHHDAEHPEHRGGRARPGAG